MLLQECSRQPSLEKVDKCLFSFDHIITAITEYSFSCLLPQSLLPSANKRSKLSHLTNDFSNPLQ